MEVRAEQRKKAPSPTEARLAGRATVAREEPANAYSPSFSRWSGRVAWASEVQPGRGGRGRGWLKAWMAERLGVRCGERASGVKSAWLGGREGKMTGCVAESGRSEVQPAGAARVMPTGKRPAPDGLEAGRQTDGSERPAAVKGLDTQRREAGGDGDGGERRAVSKAPVAERGEARGQHDGGEGGAAAEALLADRPEAARARDGDDGGAAKEGLVWQNLHTLGQSRVASSDGYRPLSSSIVDVPRSHVAVLQRKEPVDASVWR